MRTWPAILRRAARGPVGTLALIGATWFGVALWQTRHVPTGAAPEFVAPPASAVDGAEWSLAQWRAAHPGRPVALHFWADWCPVCKLEQDNVTRIASHWPVLTVAMRSGDAAAVRRELARRQLPWTAVADPHGQIAARYGVGAVPAFIVLDANGRIRAASVGYTSMAGMWWRLAWADWGPPRP